jgi:hypothetical protein
MRPKQPGHSKTSKAHRSITAASKISPVIEMTRCATAAARMPRERLERVQRGCVNGSRKSSKAGRNQRQQRPDDLIREGTRTTMMIDIRQRPQTKRTQAEGLPVNAWPSTLLTPGDPMKMRVRAIAKRISKNLG